MRDLSTIIYRYIIYHLLCYVHACFDLNLVPLIAQITDKNRDAFEINIHIEIKKLRIDITFWFVLFFAMLFPYVYIYAHIHS